MASGDTLITLFPTDAKTPATNYARQDSRNFHDVLDFAIDEIGLFPILLPRNYTGGGITVYLHYAMTSAVLNDIKLETYFERIGDNLLDIDADDFAAAQNTGDITVLAGNGKVDIVSVVHTDGAQIDSLAVGEAGRLKVKRIAVSGTDAAGDLELLRIELKES